MKGISFNLKCICMVGISLLYLQNVIFAFGWLKWYYACAFLIWGGVILYRLYRDNIWLEKNNIMIVEKKAIVLLIIGTILIVWLSGIGGFFPQTYDHIVRNPIFRDLIVEKWPVFYSEMNASLDYYFAFWLFPALIGKILYYVGMPLNVVWEIANVILMIQTACYLIITCILILSLLRKTIFCKNVVNLLLVFCSFGGISIVGYKVTEILGLYSGTLVLRGLNIEHYSDIGVLNNFFLMMTSVFNQLVPAMLCFAIFWVTRKVHIYGYLIALILLASPYPALGLFIIMSLDCIVNIAKGKKIIFKEIFSFYNIYAILWLVVVCLFYFGNSTAGVIFYKYWLKYDNIFKFLAALVIYHFFMWLCYYIVVYRQSTEKQMLWISFICLILFPFGYRDFNMRASIPALCILFVEVYKQVEEKKGKYIHLTNLLILAAVSPLFALSDLGQSVRINGTLVQRVDPYYTLETLQESDFEILNQYVKYNPQESTFNRIMGRNNVNLESHLLVGYGINQDGKRYISHVTVKDDKAKKMLLDDIAESSRNNIEIAFMENPNKVFYQFDSDAILAAERRKLDSEQTKVNIAWENYQENVCSNAMLWTLDLSIHNIGEQNILVGQGEEAYKSGVVVSLCDSNKNVLIDVFAYQFITKTIFAGDSRRMIMNLQKPEAGSYCLKIDYFCDGINGESIREYCEPQYYDINVY